MTPEEINTVIADRLAQWASMLRANGATPIVLVGFQAAARRFHVLTCTDMTNEDLAAMLREISQSVAPPAIDPKPAYPETGL